MALNRTKSMSRGAGLRPVSAARLAELAKEGIRPYSTFRPRADWKGLDRKPTRSRSKPLDNPDPHTVDIVLERDNHSCVVDGRGITGVRGVDWAIHHRKRRSQGGDHSPANLVTVCQLHHGYIHDRPEWARGHGWLLRGTDDAATVLMDHAAYDWPVLLTLDGRAVRFGHRGAA